MLEVVVPYLMVLIALLWAQQWLMAVVWLGFFVTLGLMEYVSLRAFGKTISQLFAEFREKNKWKVWILVVVFWLWCIAMTWHLLTVNP